MDRDKLIKAITDRDHGILLDLVASTKPRKTLYFLLGEAGSGELLCRDNHRRFQWNMNGRVFDANGRESTYAGLGRFKAMKGTLSCMYLHELPFPVEASKEVKFAFSMQGVEVLHG